MKLTHLTTCSLIVVCYASILSAAEVLTISNEIGSGIVVTENSLDREAELIKMEQEYQRIALLPQKTDHKKEIKSGSNKNNTNVPNDSVQSQMVSSEAKESNELRIITSKTKTIDDYSSGIDEAEAIELTPAMLNLRTRIRKVLDTYHPQTLDSARNTPWEVMHALLPYGVDANLRVSSKRQKVNAIGWLCWNEPCKGFRLFYEKDGKLGAKQGPHVQGHHGQFLAMMAQCYVSQKYEIRVGEDRFTIKDLIEFEKSTCRPKTELTFKLIALSHYLPIDAKWKSDDGQDWDLERLIKEEIEQPVIGVACGGTHRLGGLTFAVNKWKKTGKPFEGQWARAKKYIEDYQNYTYRLQNPDGSFSTSWFEGRGANPDAERRVQTTGHILEWLLFATPDEDLDDPRLLKAVNYLTNLMLRNGRRQWSIGPQGHALHALAMYDQRVFLTKPGHRSLEIAKKKSKLR